MADQFHLNDRIIQIVDFTMRPAAPLGIGHDTIEAIVDGTVVAISAFTITA